MDVVAPVHAPPQPNQLRGNAWLGDELAYLWDRCFSDIPRVNRVEVRFARCWKSRLGVISLAEDKLASNIGINGLLSLPEAPHLIARITIAHELVHYAHGFGSPLPRRYRHPHRGGIVEKELRARGLGGEFDVYHDWIHKHWYDFYDRAAISSPVAPRRTGGRRETFESQ